MLGKTRRILKLLSTINIFKTVYLNYKVFPWNVAKKLPIFVGWAVDIHEVYRGSIEFQNGIKIRRGIVSLGVCRYPMISNRGLVTLLRISPKGKLVLGDDVKIYTGCSIIVTYKGVLSIGSDFVLNQNSRLYCASSVTIGTHCRIGWETQIYDSNFHFMYDSAKHRICNSLCKVCLGHNVWVGNRCTIAKGALLPDYAIIGSNSLVSKKLENEFGGVFGSEHLSA